MIEQFFKIDPRLLDIADAAPGDCRAPFDRIDETAEYNACKVLAAFIDNRVSESHFTGTTGYGYGDRGRDTLDAVLAQIMGTEDALIRHNFVSGTHAITTALFGVRRMIRFSRSLGLSRAGTAPSGNLGYSTNSLTYVRTARPIIKTLPKRFVALARHISSGRAAIPCANPCISTRSAV